MRASEPACQRANEADVRGMRGMRGRRASHARHARQTCEPCEACEADVRGMRTIDQNITTFFPAILNTEKALGKKLTTQTVTHSMRGVSRIKFPRIIAQGDYCFYVVDYSRTILQWKIYLKRAAIIRGMAIIRGNTLVLQGINGVTCASRA